MKKTVRSGLVIAVIILLLSVSSLSGCTSEEENVVGIPKGEKGHGEYTADKATVSLPIMNTYSEEKAAVVQFTVETEDGSSYIEKKVVTLPKNSEKAYSEDIEIPSNKTPSKFDAEIIVFEDKTSIIEVRGTSLGNRTRMNASIANTHTGSKQVEVRFEVITDQGRKEMKTKEITLTQSSIEEYSQELELREDENPEEYQAKIIG